jgi:hypothetical protein
MGEAIHAAGSPDATHVDQDITDQRLTFKHFLKFTEFGIVQLAQILALLVVSFAMGWGWFAGLGFYLVIGVVSGLLLRLGGAFWAFLIATTVLLGIGGGLVTLIA